jgi:nitrite reductase (NADH) large subunit
MKILIIGNGIAGLSAAEEIRKKNKEVDIQIISKENYHTYYRTQLSHFLSKDFNVEEIYVKPEKWYIENNIIVHFNTEVLKIKEK